MAMVVIGVERLRTRRWRSTLLNSRWASCGCVPRLRRRSGWLAGRRRGLSGPGQWKAPAG